MIIHLKRIFIMPLLLLTIMLGQGAAILGFSEALHSRGIESHFASHSVEEHLEGKCFTGRIMLLAASLLICEFALFMAFQLVDNAIIPSAIKTIHSLLEHFFSIRAPPPQFISTLKIVSPLRAL